MITTLVYALLATIWTEYDIGEGETILLMMVTSHCWYIKYFF